MSARGVRAASFLDTTGDRRRARVAMEQHPSGDTHKDRSVTQPDTSSSTQSSQAPPSLWPGAAATPLQEGATQAGSIVHRLLGRRPAQPRAGQRGQQRWAVTRVGLRFKFVPQSEQIRRPQCLDCKFKSNAAGTGVLRDRSRVVAPQPAEMCRANNMGPPPRGLATSPVVPPTVPETRHSRPCWPAPADTEQGLGLRCPREQPVFAKGAPAARRSLRHVPGCAHPPPVRRRHERPGRCAARRGRFVVCPSPVSLRGVFRPFMVGAAAVVLAGAP